MKRLFLRALGLLALLGLALVASAAPGEYVGVRVCTKCHDLHGESWADTAHAKAFDSLKANTKADEKKKAKLDPAKDYTKDKDCVGCHSTGFGKPGGYAVGKDPGGPEKLGSVGCESCHGPGDGYRDEHGKAEKQLLRTSKATPRKTLVSQGQSFEYERACAACHLSYQGSPHKGAKAPYTPFTPAVDAKYKFEFDKAVRTKALHEHYKLKDVFTGDPVPAMRAEFQKTAKEIPQ
ncbi:cytochrome c family protein [Rhodoferax sp.]|uniref:cytochrome c family protein n=1 Tax=Rhodoferax sp. TaxID=50421 RepID=UPI002776E107|nr:cytochrome c family protein [Rhodoferax sp.]